MKYPRVRTANTQAGTGGVSSNAVDPESEDVAAEDEIERHETVGEPAMPPVGPTTMDHPSAADLDVVKLLVEEIMPDPLNPNEETPETFNILVSTISEDGFDQPVVVCPITDLERETFKAEPEVKYVLAKGEHRWRASRVLGHKTIPAVIRNWDSLTRRTRLVRDNNVRGETNKDKFTQLVHSLQAEHSLDSELASSLLGFDTSKEMFKLMTSDGGQKKNLEEKAVGDKAKDDLKVLDDLSLVLNTLFTKHGHTLPYGYMMFMFGGKIHAMVEMEDDLRVQVEELAQSAIDRKVNMSLMLAAILRDGLGPYRTREPEAAPATMTE